MTTEDDDLLARIQRLVDEEHHLEGEPDHPDRVHRVKELEVQLDQAWDLLRQRRARREFGGDPELTTAERDQGTVEGYRQ
jgi:hypothetical protein